MRSRAIEYITSERFIHDDLAKRAEGFLATAKDLWRKSQKIDDIAFAWPTRTVRSDRGEPIDDFVLMRLPPQRRREALQRFVARIAAYGLCTIEQRDKSIVMLFETNHGARSWTIPIERRGDCWALGKPVVQDDQVCLGFLWSPNRGTA